MKLSEKIRMITEADDLELWKNQIKKLTREQQEDNYKKIKEKLYTYNKDNTSLDERNYYTLLNKLDFLEGILGTSTKLGRVLR